MLAIVNVVIPVFAIIALGYLAVRFKLYPREGVRGLVAFVNNFASPCLLFNAMATADFSAQFSWSAIIPFYVGALVVFVVASVLSAKVFGNKPGESVSSGFSAMYTNTVLIGLPLIQRAYGDGALITTFSIHLRNNLVGGGDFITALPASVLRIYRKLHSLTELPIELSVRPPVAVVTLSHRTLAPTAQSFIQCARDIATSFASRPM